MMVASFTQVQAQLVKFGVKAGANFANQTGDANFDGIAYDKEGITSYHAGLVAEIKVMEGFAIQPELLYSTEGASYKTAGKDFINELGYISIPVLAKFFVAENLSLELGPQASFLVSEKNDFDVKNGETFEFGVVGGLGYKITENFFVQARYGLGLTEASKNADVKNSVFQVSAGFMF